MDLLASATKEGLSDLRNPFIKDCIESVRFTIRRSWRDRKTAECYAIVEFQNGPTKGEQRFDATDFNALVEKVKQFTDALT